MDKHFFELIHIAIGTQDIIPLLPSAYQRHQLYDMGQKQSLVGVCFAGIQKITDSDAGDYCGMTGLQFLTWIGMAAQIQQKNDLENSQCALLQKMRPLCEMM